MKFKQSLARVKRHNHWGATSHNHSHRKRFA